VSLTYADIQRKLEEIETKIAEHEKEWAEAAGKAVKFKGLYDKEEAIAFVKATGIERERRAKALSATVDSGTYEQHITWGEKAKAAQSLASSLETRASILQSLMKGTTREAPQTGPQPSWSRP
jgi:hypothetical protein